MRIVGGRWRGRALAAPSLTGRASAIRPTSDRLREALFNVLAHSYDDAVEGVRVLDLFAGTGALGLEALSRGAAQATFVDSGPRALALLRRNIGLLACDDRAKVFSRDATRLGRSHAAPADLVFLDPPYARGLGERAIASALAGGWVSPGALVVWEESVTLTPPPGLTLLDQRRYGETMIAIFRSTVPLPSLEP